MKNRKNLQCVAYLILGLVFAQSGCGNAKTSEAEGMKMLEKGFELQTNGNQAKALEIYSQVIGQNPQWSNGYVHRAMLFESMGENDKAIADFQKVIQLDPTDFYAAQQIAHIYRKIGETAKAEAADLEAQKIQQGYMEQIRENRKRKNGSGK